MNALVIFAKYPEPGAVKTKIGKIIGMEKSAKLCQCMIKDLIAKNSDKDYDVYLSFIGKEYKEKYRGMFPNAILYVQRGQNKGENLALSFEDLLDDYDNVCLVGCDAPQIGPKIMNAAFKALSSYDIVIGPASDGGYYLIGMSKYYEIFEDLPWGQKNLLDKTLKRLKEKKLTYVFLDELDDIDNIDEVKLAKDNLTEEQAPKTHEFLKDLEL